MTHECFKSSSKESKGWAGAKISKAAIQKWEEECLVKGKREACQVVRGEMSREKEKKWCTYCLMNWKPRVTRPPGIAALLNGNTLAFMNKDTLLYLVWKDNVSMTMFIFLLFIIHMWIHCLGHFSPCPLSLPLSPHTSPSLPGRQCSALLFSNFVEEKT
jgi:hypothetical protein